MALAFSGVSKIVVPPNAKEVRLTIPRDDEPPIGGDKGAADTKIDTDNLNIPDSVQMR